MRSPKPADIHELPLLKPVFDDIKDTLHVTYVPDLFRTLARHPVFLEGAWHDMKRSIRGADFEKRADDLRLEGASISDRLGRDILDDITLETLGKYTMLDVYDELSVMFYVYPKQVLLSVQLNDMFNPRNRMPPQMRYEDASGVYSDEWKRAVAHTRVKMIHDAGNDNNEELSRTLANVKAHLELEFLPDPFRLAARWPNFLIGCWRVVRDQMNSAKFPGLVKHYYAVARDLSYEHPITIDLERITDMGVTEGDLASVASDVHAYEGLGLFLGIFTAHLFSTVQDVSEAQT